MSKEVWIVSNLPPPVHGVSVFNEALCAGLDRLGVPHRVFAVGTRGAFTEIEKLRARKLAHDSVQLLSLFRDAFRSSSGRSRQPIIYFTPSQRGSAVLRDAVVAGIGRLLRIPLVAHVHGCAWLDEWARGTPLSHIMLTTLQRCARVVCLGPTYAAKMAQATGLPCVGINNGIDAGSGHIPKSLPRNAAVELLYLSNLIRSKGLWEAAHLARLMKQLGHTVRLRCAGNWTNTSERDEFQIEFQQELVNGTVKLVGFADKTQKRVLLENSHFFLLPTTYPLEGQPISLIEAMAYGVVPLTTCQGAIADMFVFDGWEQLAKGAHSRPEALRDTLVSLLSDPAQYERLSASCIANYERNLTADTCIRQLLKVIDDVPDRQAPARSWRSVSIP